MEGGRAAHVGVVGAEFGPERGVRPCGFEAGQELGDAVHEGFGNVLTTEGAEAGGKGGGVCGFGGGRVVQGFELSGEAGARS